MKKGIDYIGIGIGAVIINKDKKIFLSQRGKNARNEKGRWECPGGGLEFGDTLNNLGGLVEQTDSLINHPIFRLLIRS